MGERGDGGRSAGHTGGAGADGSGARPARRRAAADAAAVQDGGGRQTGQRQAVDVVDSPGGSGGPLLLLAGKSPQRRGQRRSALPGDECRFHQGIGRRGPPARHLPGSTVRAETALWRDGGSPAGQPASATQTGRSSGVSISVSAVGGGFGGSAEVAGFPEGRLEPAPHLRYLKYGCGSGAAAPSLRGSEPP